MAIMARTPNYKARWLLHGATAAALGLSIPGLAWSQNAEDKGWDLLDQMRRTEKVSSQKLDLEVRTAIADAEKLSSSDSDKAAARLRAAIALVEQDNVSPPERRELALKQLKNRLNALQAGAADAANRGEEQDRKAKAAARQAAERDRFAQDVNDIKARLALIGNMQQSGNIEGAAKEAADFKKQFPGSPAGQAVDQSAEIAEKAAAADRARSDKNVGQLESLNDVSKSATLPKGDLEFPKDWAEKTRRRAETNQLTTKERVILKALAAPVNISFKNMRLELAIDQLRAVSGQPILLDPEALKEVDASYDSPVTLNAKGVTFRTALKKILAEVGLTYIIREETIYVTSVARARDTMVVKRYYIGDLLASMNSTGLPANNGLPIQNGAMIKAFVTPTGIPALAYGGPVPLSQPGVTQLESLQNQAQTLENAKMIMDMIKNSVDPNSWTTGGGAGTISFHGPSLSIIIKQTAEMHALLGSGLAK
jgi:hypothetical protein